MVDYIAIRTTSVNQSHGRKEKLEQCIYDDHSQYRKVGRVLQVLVPGSPFD